MQLTQSLIKRIVGAAIGVAAAVMILFIGFWKTLLIGVLAYAGWWLTGSRTLPQGLVDFAARVFHLR